MNRWGIALATLAAVALVAGGASAASGPTRDPNTGGGGGGGSMTDKMTLWIKLESIPQLTRTQRYFLMLTAYGEGRYSPFAHNGSLSERAAAAKAVLNNPALVARANHCGVATALLETGSWGTFQRLAPYLSNDAFEIFGAAGMCPFANPTTTDLDFQIASAIETARDLQQYAGWKAHRTVGNLRLGWAAPALMGYLSANKARLDKYRRHAEDEKFPEGIVDATIEPFPNNVAAIYAALRAAG
jgi:hypothetical protein